MEDCVWRPAATSVIVMILNIVFIPTALVSSLLVIVAFFRSSSTGAKTEMNLFTIASAFASLLSVFVCPLRIWHHYLSTRRQDPIILYPHSSPAFVACHIVWIGTQFIGALCMVAFLLLYLLDRPSMSRYVTQSQSTRRYILAVMAIYMVSFGAGFMTTVVGFSKMQKVKTIVFCVISAVGSVMCGVLASLGRSDGSFTEAAEGDNRTTGNDGSMADDKIERIAIEEMHESKPVDGSAARLDVNVLYKIVIFCSFALVEGVLLVVGGVLNPKMCAALFWIKDMGSLIMQCYLAVSPILFIIVGPHLKAEVISMRPGRKVEPDTN